MLPSLTAAGTLQLAARYVPSSQLPCLMQAAARFAISAASQQL